MENHSPDLNLQILHALTQMNQTMKGLQEEIRNMNSNISSTANNPPTNNTPQTSQPNPHTTTKGPRRKDTTHITTKVRNEILEPLRNPPADSRMINDFSFQATYMAKKENTITQLKRNQSQNITAQHNDPSKLATPKSLAAAKFKARHTNNLVNRLANLDGQTVSKAEIKSQYDITLEYAEEFSLDYLTRLEKDMDTLTCEFLVKHNAMILAINEMESVAAVINRNIKTKYFHDQVKLEIKKTLGNHMRTASRAVSDKTLDSVFNAIVDGSILPHTIDTITSEQKQEIKRMIDESKNIIENHMNEKITDARKKIKDDKHKHNTRRTANTTHEIMNTSKKRSRENNTTPKTRGQNTDANASSPAHTRIRVDDTTTSMEDTEDINFLVLSPQTGGVEETKDQTTPQTDQTETLSSSLTDLSLELDYSQLLEIAQQEAGGDDV